MIKKSDNFIAILSGIGHLNYTKYQYIDGFYFLHPGYDEVKAPNTLKQYVDKNQPAWVYFAFAPNDGNDLGHITRVFVKIFYTDGTSSTADIAAAAAFAVPFNQAKSFFIPSGYIQRGIGNADTPTKKAYMWDICIEVDEDFILSKRFVLDCCNQYKTTLAYQNSLGGIETVMITAPKEFGLELTDGKEVERILPNNYQKHDSQFEATIPTARQTVKCNLGYKKSDNFDTMKELLLSKFVFIVRQTNAYDFDEFIPVNIDRKSVTLEREDDFEKNFSFEFSPAHEFKNFERDIWLR